MEQAECTVERLHEALPSKEALHKNKVLVLFGGGKDSTWMTAYTRLVQLLMEEKYGDTFTLRAATGRHPGMQLEVMQNIDRAYQALGMYGDSSVETLMIHNNTVIPFDPDIPLPEDVITLNRTDVLMNAHRFAADARRTFCDSCNRNLANWMGAAAAFKGGADIIVTGDSPQEQRAYGEWIDHLAEELGVSREELGRVPGFKRMLAKLDGIARRHSAAIHGGAPDVIEERRVTHREVPDGIRFFSVFEDTAYTAKDHLPFLKDFIRFDFDTLMSSFTETDCGNPALMAHLHGLAAEHLFGPKFRYEDGVREYVEYGLRLMRKKDFPDELVDLMRKRYEDDDAIHNMREKVDRYAWDAYRFTPEQMVAMVYAPFAGQGKNLHVFLEREHSDLLPQETAIRTLLGNDGVTGSVPELVDQLERISGLTVEQLRINYRGALLRDPFAEATTLQELRDKLGVWAPFYEGDPHKEIIPLGMDRVKMITGR